MHTQLQRFLNAQETAWPEALAEIQAGRKKSHWMWFIFPQLRGLGRSDVAWYYGIENRLEACRYLTHPVLGARLRKITALLLEHPGSDPQEIFGDVDAVKFCSCMTLFAEITAPDSLFARALDKYFGGRRDSLTLQMLEGQS